MFCYTRWGQAYCLGHEALQKRNQAYFMWFTHDLWFHQTPWSRELTLKQKFIRRILPPTLLPAFNTILDYIVQLQKNMRNISALNFVKKLGYDQNNFKTSGNNYHLLLESFFTSALTDGISLTFERQQISPGLPDASLYSGRSQQCCSLDGLHSSSNFQVHQSF